MSWFDGCIADRRRDIPVSEKGSNTVKLHVLLNELLCYSESAHIAAALELGCSLLRAEVAKAHGSSHYLAVFGDADTAADCFFHTSVTF